MKCINSIDSTSELLVKKTLKAMVLVNERLYIAAIMAAITELTCLCFTAINGTINLFKKKALFLNK